jgi:ABC-type transport system substrate-binding protein
LCSISNYTTTFIMIKYSFLLLLVMLMDVTQAAASPANTTLRLALNQALIHPDPLKESTFDGRRVHELIYQRLMSYDSKPEKIALKPQLAAHLPQPNRDGSAFDVTLTDANFYPAAGSALRTRKLSASDVQFSFERLLSQCNQENPECALLRKTIKRVQLLNNRKIRFHLHAPDYDFPYLLALPITAIIAPEGVTAAEFFGSHDFYVRVYRPDDQLLLERNNTNQSMQEDAAGLAPTAIHFRVLKDKAEQLRLLQRGELDYIDQLGALERTAFPNAKLSPDLLAAGAKLSLIPEAELIYYYLSPNDSQFGGNSAAHNALRKAIVQSYSVADEITQIRAGLGKVANTIVPSEFPEQTQYGVAAPVYDLKAANLLLDQHGYARGVDGWRRHPDGGMLEINFTSEPIEGVAPYRDLRRAKLASLGIRMNSKLDSYANNIKHAQVYKAPFWGAAWSALIPTPGYVLSVLRSDQIGNSNLTCYGNPAFDQLHQQAQRTAPGPKRAKMYHQLSQMIERDAIWQIGTRRQRAGLVGPRLTNYSVHPMLFANFSESRLQESSSSSSEEEWTFLKANPGQRELLAQFIRSNWFAMDAIAKERGLISEYELLQQSNQQANDWDLAVRTRYPRGGYTAIASDFKRISAEHKTVLVQGKTLRELGQIVRSEQLQAKMYP